MTASTAVYGPLIAHMQIKSELLEGAFPALPAFSRKLRNVVRGIGEVSCTLDVFVKIILLQCILNILSFRSSEIRACRSTCTRSS